MGSIGGIVKTAIGVGFGLAALHMLSHTAKNLRETNKRRRVKSPSGFPGL